MNQTPNPKRVKVIYTAELGKKYITGGQRQIMSVLEHLENNGGEVIHLEPSCFKKALRLKFRLYWIAMFLANFWYILQILTKYRNRANIIVEDYSQRFYLFLVNWVVSRFQKETRLIVFAQAFYFNCRHSIWKNWIDKTISKMFLKHASAFITSGKTGKEMLIELGVSEDKIGVVYPALREGFMKQKLCPKVNITSKGNINLLFIGRVSPIKGLFYLVEAVGILKKDNLWLTVIGDYTAEPEYMETLKRRAYALCLSENIEFSGVISEDERLLQYCEMSDIFVLPSLWDTSPIVLVEAMCAGMPIIAANVGGIPEWVEEGVNGLLIPPGDSKALACAIKKLIDNPTLRFEMGRKSFEKSLRFRDRTWEDVAKESGQIIFQTIE